MGKSTYALTLCMASVFILISQPSLAAEVVVFPDPGLDAAVRTAINKPTGDILDTDLVGTGFWRLLAVYSGISDLTGLDHCTDLEMLSLWYNNVTDLTPLAGLSKLDWLLLDNNKVVDVTPLAGLITLTYLLLEDNQIVDVAPLGSLAGLEGLLLEGNRIADVTPLANLTNLVGLGLRSNLIVDVAPLGTLTNLWGLDLTGNLVESIMPLASLGNLGMLGIGNNRVTLSEVMDLPQFPNLTNIDLSGMSITDVTLLSSVMNPNLAELNLYDNGIEDLGPLSGFTHLVYLNVGKNRVTNVAPLGDLTQLEGLTLGDGVRSYADVWHRVVFRKAYGAPPPTNANIPALIPDKSRISGAPPAATSQHESVGNQIADLSPLANLTNLHYLYADNNQISDLTFLAALTNLMDLDLSSNRITDATPLSGLGILQYLYLNSNQISDVTPLCSLPVNGLDLSANRVVDTSCLADTFFGSWLGLLDNPLGEPALCQQIPELESRGVIVEHDGTCGSPPPCTFFEMLEAEGEIVAGERGPGLGIGTDYATWDIEGIQAGSPFGDGMLDLWQLAMFADIYCNEERWLHDETVATYDVNLAAVTSELPERSDIWEWIAASVSLSSRMRDTVCYLFGLIPGNYEPVTLPGKTVNEPFSAEGDCDGDGTSNIEEYEYVVECGGDIDAFVIAASENSPFWNGNPAVPVAGVVGLLLLCAGVTFATARFRLRSER